MHLLTPIQFHKPQALFPLSHCTSESTTGLINHLLHSRPTGTRLVHFPAVWPTFGPLVNTFSSSPLLPEPSLTCLGPSLGTSLSHLRPPHISWLSHHSQVCCSTLACSHWVWKEIAFLYQSSMVEGTVSIDMIWCMRGGECWRRSIQ